MKKSLEIKLDIRNSLRAEELSHKGFWSLARRTAKKRSQPTAVEGADGQLITNIILIEDQAL